MHEIEAMLHTVAIVTMLLTRLTRSATSDTGSEQAASTTERAETRPPSCLSDRPQSVFMYGNSETTNGRLPKSKATQFPQLIAADALRCLEDRTLATSEQGRASRSIAKPLDSQSSVTLLDGEHA